MTRGHRGSLLLRCRAFSSLSSCRFIPALSSRSVQNQQTYEHPAPPPAVIAVDGLSVGRRATVEGRVREVDDTTSHGQTVLVIDIGDDSGDLRVTFSPGHGDIDIQPGQLLRITRKARRSGSQPVHMTDPIYRVIETPEGNTPGE
jgi:hypothetical protein